MQKLTRFFIGCISVLVLSSTCFAQEVPVKDSVSQINVKLQNLFSQRIISKYKIRSIKVVGNEFFDESLLLSLSTLNVGDEVQIPGGDNFSKAIRKLMDQNYFSDVSIYITDLKDKDIDVEIDVVERPRLSRFNLIGVKKTERDELSGKTGLTPNRVITENMKITAIEGIKKFYAEKGFQDASVVIKEQKDASRKNNIILDFVVDRGPKVRINNINFGGNKIEEIKITMNGETPADAEEKSAD